MSQQKEEHKFSHYYSNPEWRKKYIAYQNAKITCECGAEISRGTKSLHMKSKKHQNNMKHKESYIEICKELRVIFKIFKQYECDDKYNQTLKLIEKMLKKYEKQT